MARKVSRGEVDRGILVCGTGLGMCDRGQQVPGVRAAPCHDDLTAEMSRRHNDSNMLCLSADLLGERLIDRMVEIWLSTPFEGGRHARRLAKIAELEQEVERGRSSAPRNVAGDSAEKVTCSVARLRRPCKRLAATMPVALCRDLPKTLRPGVKLGRAVSFVTGPHGENAPTPFSCVLDAWKVRRSLIK